MGYLDGAMTFPTRTELLAAGETHQTKDEAGITGNFGLALEEIRGLERRVETMSTMPAFAPGVITYPANVTTNHQHDLAIVSGARLRMTGGSGITDNSLRVAYGHAPSGVMGNSEVRTVLAGSNVNFDTTLDRVQYGHVHRYTRTRRVLLEETDAAAVGANTIDIGGTPPWASGEWVGGKSEAEVWVQIVFGDGRGLKRRVISNDTNTLTVFPSWTANGGTIPSAITDSSHTRSRFEIYSYQVRAISIVMGNVFGPFGGHGFVQPNIWDNGSYKQPGIGQQDLGGYLDPLGAISAFKASPHNLKTRVIGNTAEMAIWAAGDPECAYGTAGQSVSWILGGATGELGANDDYGYADEPGMSGVYLAHLNAGDYIELDSMTVTRL